MTRLLRWMASPRLTLLLLLWLLAASAVLLHDRGWALTWVLALPLFALSLNLMAAIATNGVFRKQLPLLIFHLALLMLLLLSALGRMMVLHGRAEVTTGSEFSGLSWRDAGPWHAGALENVAFVNGGFAIDYLPGPRTDQLRARLHWRDGNGLEHETEIEPTRPLILYGYRIAPTANKGFAPVLAWRAPGRDVAVGSIHLPSFPAESHRQSADWTPDGAEGELWLALDVADDLIPADRPSQFRVPDRQTLVLRYRDQRFELNPGDRVDVAGGTLEYRELRTWMGFTFFHDWTIPWLLAACALAVASLGWHFWRKFAAVPWNREPEHGT